MRRLREIAGRTPAQRERYVDLLRAVAIIMVVLGHWLIAVIDHDDQGGLRGHSALEELVSARPGTWLFQVMPLFFLVGGYANAASLEGHRRRGGYAGGWLRDRSGRLLRPTTVLLVVLAVAALTARLLGGGPTQIRNVVWYATVPLWFLSAYLCVVLLTPVMYALHRRFGLAVPAVLLVLIVLGDVGRLLGPERLSYGNYLFGWLAMHQVGFAWRTGDLPMRPRVGVPLLLVGLTALPLLTFLGPYPTSMINQPGERIQNMSPPSLALLALATAQLGLIMLFRGSAERWLRRTRPWTVVVGMNAVVLTIFLWHLTAVILLAGALDALGVLPTPQVGSTAWWLWRIPWLVLLAVVLAVLVAAFGRIELRGSRRPAVRPRWLPAPLCRTLDRPLPRLLLLVVGFAATVVGLFSNNVAPKSGEYLFGLPTVALVGYLFGAALLRLLRSVPTGPPG
ncbi:acyltransferase family protein [Plantactinospora soyae]|uniref:Fucose 4-O-acetylase-like acetyltransferase n=1 Tax=Plantactinospora soyae TaxID=1544732 RepID=A0A927ME75_9ACTN|nr:acyltransferase [Plantactinospora soyae]MBE1492035.1 fucose 4-O-acetylase-like acetyltransferase [Plantactinospora soyae]